MTQIYTRRAALELAASAAASFHLHQFAARLPNSLSQIPPARPTLADRKFSSAAVESYIAETQRRIPDPGLSILFANCFPNTLDTAVQVGTFEGKPDTVVLTGDIPAMWMRDSSAQVWPYLQLAPTDPALLSLLDGVIRRQARCILIDSYANAFMANLDDPPLSWTRDDKTEMRRGVGERKYELDSLCYPIRLSYGFWRSARSIRPFDSAWADAMRRIVATMRAQQRKNGQGPYRFQRLDETPAETLPNDGLGSPVNPVGLVASGFRPSDDACTFPFLVPANLFAVASLRQLAEMAHAVLKDDALAAEAHSLAQEIDRALHAYGTAPTRTGKVWAYEVDGFGSTLLMDDANVPSLLSLPYLCRLDDASLYARTRQFAWSSRNPWFLRGSAGEGVGSPHTGMDMIWPVSQIIFALTSNSDEDIRRALRMLKASGSEGLIHESYFKDDPRRFTRPWFAWANSLFGELLGKLTIDAPQTLRL